ncbi:glyoxylate/hydroxypyruvate reductase A [Komagataeibacter rhaeticus]|uniref:2-hydroxyacid dehydrogenase n=1 Tax=Komagataeibacter rhaeticus TaxID=215221 RepID=UPI0004DAF8DC|nr:glyoxylate/hydroxypyruvate reductase A [Komagataeibacter rhaeticus]KDU97284.1 2-hydroxyacid dehydrogenase [Komagataeibacter rhaeticus AF1]MBL7239778.1 glyoxylate/hydroxypyruvate reductase A [Komagataeibacter rhaeticus]PYD53346.1 glyoxylate/hydroxypyruvate reductase A [Komagataeibacter rhaeticus]GBQ12170.1 D-3-phosphoglycerate dehydrogenase [Komagataeibacter rhaeticus DSM 16663]
MSFVLKLDQKRERHWKDVFHRLMPDMPFHFYPDYGDPADVEYIAMWRPEPDLFTRFPNLRLVFSLGAGVDQFDLSTFPDHVGLVKMIEPSLTAGMVEYVTAFVLATHRDLPLYRTQQMQHLWKPHTERRADRTSVGIMGMGTLGIPCAAAIRALGFNVRGWNRSHRDVDGVSMFVGNEQLDAFLAETDILISLLPLTPQTRGLFNNALFARLPAGASVINAGRGPQVVTDDLLAALDSGHLRWAVLDVTDPEPLPADSRLWDHPGVIITPHIASNTHPESGAESVINTIRNFQAGRTPEGLVDRQKRY